MRDGAQQPNTSVMLAGRSCGSNRARRRPIAEERGQSLPARDDPSLRHRAVLGQDTPLALAFVEIESYRIHWLATPVCASSRDDEHGQLPSGANLATAWPWRFSRFMPTS
jgi:hypothetical protein